MSLFDVLSAAVLVVTYAVLAAAYVTAAQFFFHAIRARYSKNARSIQFMKDWGA